MNKSLLTTVATLLACFAFQGGIVQGAMAGQVTALKCGTLLDVEQKKSLNNITVTIDADRIIAVEKNGVVPADAKVIDLSDKICLPGLMDMHVHPTIFDGQRRHVSATDSSAFLVINAIRSVQKLLQAGFTTLRIPGEQDHTYGMIDLRNAINNQVIEGPRLFVAPHRILSENHVVPTYPVAIPAGTDAARNEIRKQIRYGADFIKVNADLGGIFMREISRWHTVEEMKALVDEAHAWNKPITSHAHGDEAIRVAVMAGYDSIEHGFFMSESTAKEMKKRGTYLIPTLSVFDMLFDEKMPVEEQYLESFMEEYFSRLHNSDAFSITKEQRKIRDKSFKYAYKIGVKMAFGSDRGGIVRAHFREFAYLARLGVTPWDTIQMATINAAELLNKTDQLGSIEVGKFADIIALSESPLNDIEAFERGVDFVMKGGEIVHQK